MCLNDSSCKQLTLGGWKPECSLVHCVGLGSSDPLKPNPALPPSSCPPSPRARVTAARPVAQ